MEQMLHSHVDAPSGFLVALRHKIRSFETHRQHRRDMKTLAQLPNHVLHDIGFEDLNTPQVNGGTFAR